MVPDVDRVGNICLSKFDQLPKMGKPLIDKEWTVMSCIVEFKQIDDTLEVVALGTGTKCIGRDALSSTGDILNDSHAEVICRRGFLRYIYNEIFKCNAKNTSIFTFNTDVKKYELSTDVSYHLFTTHAPCGDASIFKFTATDDDANDQAPEPKRFKTEIVDDVMQDVGSVLDNDNNFTGAKLIPTNFDVPLDLMSQNVGQLRTKPGRGVRTLSMSCSDKLARWNVLGLQGALLHSVLSAPIYLKSIALCGAQCEVDALERAIWNRWPTVSLPAHFQFANPIIRKCSKEIVFPHEKDQQKDPAPGSIVWCKVDERPLEVAVNGRKLGATKKQRDKRSGRLLISKIELFQKYLDIDTAVTSFDRSNSYVVAKKHSQAYLEAWLFLKEKYFLTWTVKTIDLLEFKVSET